MNPFILSTVVEVITGNMLDTLCTICKLIMSIKLTVCNNITKTTLSNTVTSLFIGNMLGSPPERFPHENLPLHRSSLERRILVGWGPLQPRSRDPVAFLKEQKGQSPTLLLSPLFSLNRDYYVSGDFTIHLRGLWCCLVNYR